MTWSNAARSARASAAAVVAVCLVALMSTVGWAAGQGPGPHPGPNGASGPHRPVCGPAADGTARCHADVITKADGSTPAASPSPSSSFYGPADLQSAYQLPGASDGAGKTVAIVDAYDNPNAESDLAAY